MRVNPTEALAAEGQLFDVVCSLEVIEHVNNPELFLDSLCSIIKVPRMRNSHAQFARMCHLFVRSFVRSFVHDATAAWR